MQRFTLFYIILQHCNIALVSKQSYHMKVFDRIKKYDFSTFQTIMTVIYDSFDHNSTGMTVKNGNKSYNTVYVGCYRRE